MVSLGSSLTSHRRDFFICWLVGGATLSQGHRMRQKIVELSCEGWLKYTDLTLAYIFDHAVCCASAASSGRSLHLITSQLRMKPSSSNYPIHVRWTESSIKKWIIVHRTVRCMFGEQTFAQLRTGLKQRLCSQQKFTWNKRTKIQERDIQKHQFVT